jgi:hypothetical protein
LNRPRRLRYLRSITNTGSAGCHDQNRTRPIAVASRYPPVITSDQLPTLTSIEQHPSSVSPEAGGADPTTYVRSHGWSLPDGGLVATGRGAGGGGPRRRAEIECPAGNVRPNIRPYGPRNGVGRHPCSCLGVPEGSGALLGALAQGSGPASAAASRKMTGPIRRTAEPTPLGVTAAARRDGAAWANGRRRLSCGETVYERSE